MNRESGKTLELLAPAGDWEALRAAVANGADAVYFGLSNFNARHRANNFTADELPQVMNYLHDHNVKGYVAFNTLIFSDELDEAVRFGSEIASAGVDAVIVQDIGLARLLQRLCPSLPLHASTQMTLTEPRGIELVRSLGIQRVILARELSIPEIQKITQATAMPVEVFVHGALCVAYSGQCLTSESLGGRSANRGQCAQACRLPYELIVDGEQYDLDDRAYLLSPQDLAGYDRITELTNAGVNSFKIEGRLKSAHYVAAATQAYRAAVDAAQQGVDYQISRQQKSDLMQSFSRGFTHAFLDGVNHQQLVPARFPKSRGIHIGTVAGKTHRSLIIELSTQHSAPSTLLKPGDGVVFDEGHPEQDEQGGRVFSVKPMNRHPERSEGSRHSNNKILRSAQNDDSRCFEVTFGHGDLNLPAIAVGSMVWKTDDPAVRKRLEQSFNRDLVAHRVPLQVIVNAFIGSKLQITAQDNSGHEVTVEWDQPLQSAQKHPLSIDLLRDQFSRLGQTPFELGDLKLNGDGAMVPKSILNDLRRQAVEQLLKLRAQSRSYPIADPQALEHLRNPKSKIENPKCLLTVLVRSLDQLNAVLDWQSGNLSRPSMVYCDFEDVRRYADAVARARSAQMPIGLGTIRIVKPHEQGLLKQIADSGPDAVLVRNLAGVSFYREQYPHLPLIGDYSLNIANELASDFFADLGLVRMVPSYDLNWPQLQSMLQQSDPSRFEVVIHQHMPMFHMEHCVFAATLSNGKDFHDCGRPCEKHRVELRDRVGMPHPLLADVGCRNTLFNATAQSAAQFVPAMKKLGISFYRIEMVRENAQETHQLLDHYARLLSGQEQPKAVSRSLHVLNQLGVTTGTLEYE